MATFVRDPVPLTVGDRAFLFYDGDNNDVGSCAIGLVTAPAHALVGSAVAARELLE